MQKDVDQSQKEEERDRSELERERKRHSENMIDKYRKTGREET